MHNVHHNVLLIRISYLLCLLTISNQHESSLVKFIHSSFFSPHLVFTVTLHFILTSNNVWHFIQFTAWPWPAARAGWEIFAILILCALVCIKICIPHTDQVVLLGCNSDLQSFASWLESTLLLHEAIHTPNVSSAYVWNSRRNLSLLHSLLRKKKTWDPASASMMP